MTDLGVLNRSTCRVGFRYLVVEFDAVRDDDEGPVAGDRAQNLLCVEYHRETLAAALGLPEHARAPVPTLPCRQCRHDGVIHADDLMVLPEDLREAGLVLGEQREARDKVEQALLVGV